MNDIVSIARRDDPDRLKARAGETPNAADRDTAAAYRAKIAELLASQSAQPRRAA